MFPISNIHASFCCSSKYRSNGLSCPSLSSSPELRIPQARGSFSIFVLPMIFRPCLSIYAKRWMQNLSYFGIILDAFCQFVSPVTRLSLYDQYRATITTTNPKYIIINHNAFSSISWNFIHTFIKSDILTYLIWSCLINLDIMNWHVQLLKLHIVSYEAIICIQTRVQHA